MDRWDCLALSGLALAVLGIGLIDWRATLPVVGCTLIVLSVRGATRWRDS